MTWCLRKHRRAVRGGRQPLTTSAREAEAARARATVDLENARARWGDVKRVTRSLRQLREENGFLPKVEHLFQGRN